MLVWIGSVLALLGAAGFGFNQLSGIELQLLIVATLIYLFGVQLPTIIVNVPLNNELQRLDISSADQEILKNARSKFESRWNRWNIIRTILATTTSLLLIIIVFLL